MGKEAGVLKEYEMLREELMHTGQIITQLIGIAMGFIGIITVQGFVSREPYAFLVTLPIAWVASLYIADQRWVVWLIASYIQVHIEEPGYGPQWESRLHFAFAMYEGTSFHAGAERHPHGVRAVQHGSFG